MNYISNNSGDGSSVKSDRNLAIDASEYANQSRTSTHEEGSKTKNYPKIEEEKKLKDELLKNTDEKVKEVHSSSSIYDEEVRAYNRTDPRQEDEFSREDYQFEFYVDEYSDEKIKEIISIFRNDFKPPKNLWIENMNIQGTAEANYFNDVFEDDEIYNETEESSPRSAIQNNAEEIDDIGCNISEVDKSKLSKKKEEIKTKEINNTLSKPKDEKCEDKNYADRIKPTDPNYDSTGGKSKKPMNVKPEVIQKPEDKQNSKDIVKTSKSKKKKAPEPTEKEYKTQKAKDGLNIEIPSDHLPDSSKKAKTQDSGKSNKKGSKTPKTNVGDDLNKTSKIPSGLLEGLSDEELEKYAEETDHKSDISYGRLAKECEDEIEEKLLQIEDEKAKLEFERHFKKKRESKKGIKSKNRPHTGNRSTREGYGKKRANSHKKRGSTSMMQELKKKMGFINSQTSRGRTGGEQYLNYSLDEINQKLQAHASNYNTSGMKGKGMKKRLNKSFENVFSA